MIGTSSDYPAVIPYLTCGWPNPDAFLESVDGLVQAGCPFFEVGFPFSDPIADGPVIQRSSAQALEAGMTVRRCFELTRQATERSGRPAVCMTYANLVSFAGMDNFCQCLAEAGGAGLIVPDLSFEESPPLAEACARAGLELISFVAPTSAPARRAQIANQAQGFLYLVAVRGVTGGATEMSEELAQLIADSKAASQVPVLVGFGIRGAEQVSGMLARGADGVIVGTALIEEIGRAHEQGRAIGPTVRDFLAPMVQAARSVRSPSG
jgi:tryptophan synthase alpha chain